MTAVIIQLVPKILNIQIPLRTKLMQEPMTLACRNGSNSVLFTTNLTPTSC